MQKVQYIITLVIVLLTISVASAQSQTGTGKYALLVRKGPHIQSGIKTAQDLKENENMPFEKMEIIVCGQVVKDLSTSDELKEYVASAEKNGVQIAFCGMSMKKFGADPASLPKGVSLVQNGMVRIFELQNQGYQTIEL